MTKLLSGERVAEAIAKKLMGDAHPLIEDMRQQTASAHPDSRVIVSAAGMRMLIGEVDMLREVAARLGTEVRAFRNNVQLQRDAPPSRDQSCLNCRFFEAVKSTEAHIVVGRQAIVQDAGACCRQPPSPGPRGSSGDSPSTSFFTPVHPSKWCGGWELLDNRRAAQ